MARKFKKKLAPKRTTGKKNQAVLSVELIRKEYINKAKDLVGKLISMTKSFKLN